MTCTVDPKQLSDYVAKITDQELLEDLSHLFEIDIVTSALASSSFGNTFKLPLSSVSNITKAFMVYRDELALRSTNSDKEEDTSFTLLAEYYKCVKMVRSLTKYLNRVVPAITDDFSKDYTSLLQHKASLIFSQSALES